MIIPRPVADMNGNREVCWELPPDPELVSKTRKMVRETLTTWHMSALAEDAILIISELYSNSLLHGRPPITLTLQAAGSTLRGEVTDHGDLWPAVTPGGLDDEHGRGLTIVAAYANRWGIDPLPQQLGKTTWFILKRSRNHQ